MKRILVLASAAVLAAPMAVTPGFASAQSYRDYGAGDVCAQQRKEAGTKGAIAGGILGGVLGSAVSGRGAKTEGAALGAVAGAVAGNQIAKRRVQCGAYPKRVAQTKYSRSNCRWVQEYYGGRNHSFEVCRGRDGVWRPSGRT